MNIQRPEAMSFRASIATGRSRQRAVPIIAAKLRDLAGRAEFRDNYPGPTADVRLSQLYVFFCKVPGAGTYFSVEARAERGFVMTGYLDPVRPGKFDQGQVHVMSWRRGWEARLFDDAGQTSPVKAAA